MAQPGLDYTYTYRQPSAVVSGERGQCLSLVTSGTAGRDKRFFNGSVRQPRRTADLMLAVVEVAQSRFHIPARMLGSILLQADPVITCGGERLRFEAFSACCGVYARLDLLPGSMDGEHLSNGTTNVDFNAPTRAALSRLRENDPLNLEVGAEGLQVRHAAGCAIERKVKLPLRWLRGFVEVQALQSRMQPRLEASGAELRRFLREAPRAWKGPAWVSRAGGGLRLSHTASTGSVAVGGVARLRVMETAARHATRVRVHAGAEGSCGWEIETPDSRFHLVFSPDVWRGFSGEGQALNALAKPARERAMGAVRAGLRWQAKIDAAELARQAGLDRDAVEWALAQCAASGLVGYDLADQVYFHRELPFDLGLVTKLQPRLVSARKLIADGAVRIQNGAAWVRSGEVEYRTEMGRCTCPWFAKYAETRGPCKHLLAVQIASGDADDVE